MSTDIFLGGLASLVLVAVIIVTLTANKSGGYSASAKRSEKKMTNGGHKSSGR